MDKQPLGPYLKEKSEKEFGSLAEAARKIGIPYERFKWALRANTFKGEDLLLLFPGKSAEEVGKEFSFEIARKYVNNSDATPKSVLCALQNAGLDEADILFILENKAVARKIVSVIRRECDELRKIFTTPP